MKFYKTELPGAYVIRPEPFKDHRGSFARLYCADEMLEIGHYKPIVQVNHSVTEKIGVIRGMHYQAPPSAEIKIVKVTKGVVFDVIIDVRKGSPTFLKHHTEVLSSTKGNALYIPEGFAHGFQTMTKGCEVMYFHTALYGPKDSKVIRYDDPAIRIMWPIEVTGISEQDRECPWLNKRFEGV
jgi:dTDP-4-dehydrorhamnose 3,5-epimerase